MDKVFFLGVALLFSAFFSGSETALTAAHRIKLEVWVRRRKKGARHALKTVQHPERFLVTTLVGNNLAMVAASSLMALWLESRVEAPLIPFISALILLVVGEIVPKTIAADRPTGLSIPASFFIRLASWILSPFVWVTRRITARFFRFLGLRFGESERVFGRREMAWILEEGVRRGVVGEADHDLISRFILRSQGRLREIMIPRTEMVVAPADQPIQEVLLLFEKTGYSRLPVIEGGLDDVIGLITVKDVVLLRPTTVQEVLREIHFVPEFTRIGPFFREMRERRINMSIVVDEYGGTAGLVTLEDLAEAFFGDILDEYDEESELYRIIGPGRIEVKARMEVEDLNTLFGLDLPVGEYHTLSGLILATLGRIPKRGERLHFPGCTMTILSGTTRSIYWVRLVLDRSDEATQETVFP